jgi:hypothetical protein
MKVFGVNMNNFQPNYVVCKDDRKEIYWGICKHLKKDEIVYCTLKNNTPCIALKGYKHE